MAQFVVRVEEELAAEVDQLVEDGVVPSRSEAVRRALREFVDRWRRAMVAKAIVAGYQRIPQTEDEAAWTDAATVAMVAEEPW